MIQQLQGWHLAVGAPPGCGLANSSVLFARLLSRVSVSRARTSASASLPHHAGPQDLAHSSCLPQ